MHTYAYAQAYILGASCWRYQKCFEYTGKRKLVRDSARLLENQEIKGELREGKAIVEKPNEFFALVLTNHNVGEIPKQESLFPGDKLIELIQIDTSMKDVIEEMIKLTVVNCQDWVVIT